MSNQSELLRLDGIANLGSPMQTYGIMRLNKGIIDCYDLYIAVLDAVDSLSAWVLLPQWDMEKA